MMFGLLSEITPKMRKYVLNLAASLMLALFVIVIVSALRAGWMKGAGINWDQIDMQQMGLPIVSVVMLLSVVFTPDRWYPTRVNLFLLVPVGYGFLHLWQEDGLGYGWVFLFAAAVLAFVLSEEWQALTWNVFIVVGVALVGGGRIYLFPSPGSDGGALYIWLINSVVFYGVLSTVGFVLLLMSRAYKQEMSALTREVSLLRKERDELVRKSRFSEQAYQSLERRTVRLIAVNSIMGMLENFSNEQELLSHAVDLILEYFDLLRVRVYLADERWEWLILRAVSPEPDLQATTSGYRWLIKPEGLIGYVAYTGHARIASAEDLADLGDGEEAVSSVLALPLILEERTVGVLELTSGKPDAFLGEDVPVFQSLTTKIAAALKQVWLLQEYTQTIRQLQEAFGLEISRGWRRRSVVGYRYTPTGVRPLAQYGHIEIATDTPQRLENNGIAVPLKYIGRILGILKLYREPERPWLEAEIGFVKQITTTIVRALENARLLEEARRRAERDHIFSEISARLRTSLDLDWIMKNTIQELNRVLGAEVTAIKLISSSDTDNEEHQGSEEMSNA